MIVPTVELPPATPFTSQMTAVLVEEVEVVFERFTVAVKSVCAPGAILAAEGVIEPELTVTAFEPPPPQPHISSMAGGAIKRQKTTDRQALRAPKDMMPPI